MKIRFGILGLLLITNLSSVNVSAGDIGPTGGPESECGAEKHTLTQKYILGPKAKYEEWKKEVKRRWDVARALAEVAQTMQTKLESPGTGFGLSYPGKTRLDEIRRYEEAFSKFKKEIDKDWAFIRFQGIYSTDYRGLKASNYYYDGKIYLERMATTGLKTEYNYIATEDRLAKDKKTVKNTKWLLTDDTSYYVGRGLEVCYFDGYAKRTFGLPKRNCVIFDMQSTEGEPNSHFKELIQLADGSSHLVVSAESDKTITALDIFDQLLRGAVPWMSPPNVANETSGFQIYKPGICETAPLSLEGYIQCAATPICASFKNLPAAQPHLDKDRTLFLLNLLELNSTHLGDGGSFINTRTLHRTDHQGDSSESSGSN